jgi:hypothetical protein
MTTPNYRPPEAFATQPYSIEFYYKVRWGFAQEFLELFRKNHYPLLARQLETGRILEIRAEQPRFHTGEADRWDYRVTLVYANLMAAHDSAHEASLIPDMYPDQETFQREEQRRFELLLGHWDVPLSTVTFDP